MKSIYFIGLVSCLIVSETILAAGANATTSAPKKVVVPAAATEVKIKSFTPQNLTNTVNQVRVEFTTKMVSLSRPDQNADIFSVKCMPGLTGYARWQSETMWTYDFQTKLSGNKLAGGTRCQFELKKDVKALSNVVVAGNRTFEFQVDGPNVVSVRPGKEIVEDQVFVFDLDTAVDETSFLENSYFIVDGKANRVSAELVTGAASDLIIKSVYRYSSKEEKQQPRILIKSKELFPAKSKVRFVLAPGVKSKASGIARSTAANFDFVVRAGFSAEFSCERENPKAACIPFTGMNLSFSAQVPASQAKSIRLVGKGYDKAAVVAEGSESVESVSFAGPFPANAELKVVIPAGIKDDAGRPLNNQTKFPLSVKTADFPPLVKFNSTFGVLESKESILLPVTLRNLENQVLPDGSALIGQSVKFSAGNFPAAVQMMNQITNRGFDKRHTSILNKATGVQRFQVPMTNKGKAFEVVGIPLSGPGIYAVELQSKRLGESLVGAGKTMYVPTVALVTNLAVHFKWGRENSLIWVTSLNDGKPVASAKVGIHACDGTQIWSGTSDARGLVSYQGNVNSAQGNKTCKSTAGSEGEEGGYDSGSGSGLYVTAQLNDDFSFTHTTWTQGIESWRFGQNDGGINARSPGWNTDASTMVHTIFDRTLLRAGETIHMKHVIRKPIGTGFAALAKDQWPTAAVVSHEGSDAKYTVAISWDEQNLTAISELKLPSEALLGTYSVVLTKGDKQLGYSTFRVEEFKVPLYVGSIVLPKDDIVKPTAVDAMLSVNYQNGGPVSGLKGTVRYYLSAYASLQFKKFDGFSFSYGGVKEGVVRSSESQSESEEKVFNQPVSLDKTGTARVTLNNLKTSDVPQTLSVELEYRDSNGETQTVSESKSVMPASRHVGLKIGKWIASTKEVKVEVAVADLKGNPVAGAPFEMKAYKTTNYSHRTRLVGGFYSYESLTEIKEVPAKFGCQPKTDAKGLAVCKAKIAGEGQITVVAQTMDAAGNRVSTRADVYVNGKDNYWFEAENNDRIDLIAEKKDYQPNEIAKLQVRMPFREATALVTVEREGILSAQVVTLDGKNPTVLVPIKDHYAPNIFVSTLVVRGRVAANTSDTTATVDLAKPAYKMGLTTLNVDWKAHKLNVDVQPNKEIYNPREEASVNVKVLSASGAVLPAGAEIAVAVVDEGLLMISPNKSWDLLSVMMNNRPLETETSTVQMQVIGKRHFGLKAVPHGGGGGSQQMTRELFDTLVYWNPKVKVGANGQAVVKFKMNDSLTKFRVVAVATAGMGLFGSGQATIVSNQNLITTTSLPTMARTLDQFEPEFTFRNTTNTPFAGSVKGLVTFKMADGTTKTLAIAATAVAIDAKGSKTLSVAKVVIPDGATQADYDLEVLDAAGNSQDRIKIGQSVRSSNVVRTMMSSLKQIQQQDSFEVARPEGAVADLGGIKIAMTPSLASGLTTVKQYMYDYPFISLETKFSTAVISNDAKQWADVAKQMSSHIDQQGLLKFYPGSETGSAALTSFVLTASHLGQLKLPETIQTRLVTGLQDYVAGKIRTQKTALTPMENFSGKVLAMEALARHKSIKAVQLSSLPEVQVSQMGTATLISYMNVLSQLGGTADKAKKDEVLKALEARLTLNGTRYSLANNTDSLWLVNSSDASMARLIIMGLQSSEILAAWTTKMPELVRGLLSQNEKGRWDTTIANVYGTLALRGFSAMFEKTAVAGVTKATTSTKSWDLNWDTQKYGGAILFKWPKDGKDTLKVDHQGAGAPWALVSTQAAVTLTKPLFSGFEVKKSIQVVSQKTAGTWSVGDIAEVKLQIKSNAASAQVALIDPIPAGAKIINGGSGERKGVWAAYEQMSYEAYKAFYEWVPNTEFEVTYQIQFNQAGTFKLTPTRVESVYSPENFGEIPNQDINISQNP